MGMWVTAALVVLVTAGLVPLLTRDVERSWREQELRRRLWPMRVRFERFAAEVGRALIPTMREGAAALGRFTEAMQRAGITSDALRGHQRPSTHERLSGTTGRENGEQGDEK